MFLSLIENGIDSLNYGLNAYKDFLSLENRHANDNPTCLKVAIIMVHNGLELLLKNYIASLNELLIYDYKDDKKQEALLSEYATVLKTPGLTLEKHLLQQNLTQKTVDYSGLIKIFKCIYNPTDKEWWCLKKIGDYRNQLTHYGVNLQNEYYGILQAIHGTLDLILEGNWTHAIDFQLRKPLQQKFDDIFLQSEENLKDEWTGIHKDSFELITTSIKHWITLPEYAQLLCRQETSFDWNSPKANYDPYLEFHIKSLSTNTDYPFYTINVPFLNTTFFADDYNEDGPIYFLLDHDIKESNGKKLYIFKEPFRFNNYEYCDTKFWLEGTYKKNREVRDFSSGSFIYALNNTITSLSSTKV